MEERKEEWEKETLGNRNCRICKEGKCNYKNRHYEKKWVSDQMKRAGTVRENRDVDKWPPSNQSKSVGELPWW